VLVVYSAKCDVPSVLPNAFPFQMPRLTLNGMRNSAAMISASRRGVIIVDYVSVHAFMEL